MAYQDDLYHIMTSDTSLNTLVNNRIFFETLEENYDITKDWIVFSFRKASQVDCINSKNAFTNYIIFVRIISPSTETTKQLSDYIQDMLNGKEYNGIQDIWFINDTHSFDLDKDQYSNLLEFNSIYI